MTAPARPAVAVTLPTMGPHAGPESIATVARAADRLGLYGVAATERLLLPAHEGWDNWAGLPDTYVWDPIEALTYAAAVTTRVRLSTGIVNALFEAPILLARRLATLDRLSGGRLDVGLGQGWLAEEFVAVGVPTGRRGAGFEEHLAAVRACWGPDPVEHEGEHYRIPRSKVGPKPVQGADIPLMIGAVAAPAVERAARLGAGFVTGVRDWETSAGEIATYRAAGGPGRVAVQVMSTWGAAPDDPADAFVAWAVGEVDHAGEAGADEVRFELNLTGVAVDRQVGALEALADALSLRPDG
ncbi:MAG TPA: TIGR03619 family F420-dependent LLM class oxidoreductase [Acidimicrobiales bacterium]|nr:TIGR03619 family F420-dependent LLM class oxidoreductase [Acidimicrobiales bacterium]